MSVRVGSYDFDNYITNLYKKRDRYISSRSPTQAKQVGDYVDKTSVVDPEPLRLVRARGLLMPTWDKYIPLLVGIVTIYAMK